MKKLALLAIFLAVPFLAKAQTVKVVQLSPDEARESKTLNEELNLVETKLSDLRKRIMDKYFSTNQSFFFPIRDFQYSDDYKFVVPISPELFKMPPNCSSYPSSTPYNLFPFNAITLVGSDHDTRNN